MNQCTKIPSVNTLTNSISIVVRINNTFNFQFLLGLYVLEVKIMILINNTNNKWQS